MNRTHFPMILAAIFVVLFICSSRAGEESFPREMAYPPLRSGRTDRSMDPRHNRDINPKYNRTINPNHNRDLNPKFNRDLNPDYTRTLNPNYTKKLNPRYQRDLNPMRNNILNPRQNGGIDPFRSSWSGYYLNDLAGNPAGVMARAAEGVYNIFGPGRDWTGFALDDAGGGMNTFDLEGTWTGYLR
ncbi:hypothetical protein ACFL2P_03075, partial [Candidatus Moduliflexota bacterium]